MVGSLNKPVETSFFYWTSEEVYYPELWHLFCRDIFLLLNLWRSLLSWDMTFILVLDQEYKIRHKKFFYLQIDTFKKNYVQHSHFQEWFFSVINWFQLFSSEKYIWNFPDSQDNSKMNLLKRGVDGFSYLFFNDFQSFYFLLRIIP